MEIDGANKNRKVREKEQREEHNLRSMHSKRKHETVDVYNKKVFLETTSIYIKNQDLEKGSTSQHLREIILCKSNVKALWDTTPPTKM